jgi:hypothetical protein
MSNKITDLEGYLNKYQNCQIALKNLYEISKGFEYQELTKDMEFSKPQPYFNEKSFVNIRKVILNQENRKKVKNPNLQIKLNNFIELKELRKKYDYVIGYDGIDSKNSKLAKSFIKLVLGKWNQDKTKINKIMTFLVLNTDKTVKHLNGGIENLNSVNKLFNLMENWIFTKSKNKELKENYENLNFYIVADKHRTIVSKMNEIMIDGFISSNPTTYEKFENQNFKLKQKLNLTKNISEFNENFEKILIA